MNWTQLRTVLWLRWRLTRNQWSRGGRINAFLAVVMAVVVVLLGLAGGVGGTLAGAFLLGHTASWSLLLAWDALVCALLFFWTLGLVTEIQRSESIDLSRLLHLPISLGQVFVVNYLASHLTLSLILFVPAMLGLAAGLVWSRGWLMLGLAPLALGFIFMLSAWTYCLRGWLVSLMVNKRRRRAIIVGITTAFMLLSQVPNLLINVFHDRTQPRPGRVPGPRGTGRAALHSQTESEARFRQNLLIAHQYLPPLWVGNGAFGLAAGNIWPALLASVATIGLGALGLRRAYRATLRFYQGAAERKPAAPENRPRTVAPADAGWLEWDLPGVPREAAALALASLRSMVRAPEIKMMLASNVIMPLIVAVMLFSRGASGVGESFKPLIATGAVAATFLGLVQLMFNQFGSDRDGFRALVLLPTLRRHVLLGKNLALFPLVLGMGLAFQLLLKLLLHIPWAAVGAAALQLMAAFLLLATAGNWVSLTFPYRIVPGSMKPTKAPALTSVMIVVSHLLLPLVLIPLLLPPTIGLVCGFLGWLPPALRAHLVNLLGSGLLLGATALCYWLSLEPLGERFQAREKRILEVVTHEVE